MIKQIDQNECDAIRRAHAKGKSIWAMAKKFHRGEETIKRIIANDEPFLRSTHNTVNKHSKKYVPVNRCSPSAPPVPKTDWPPFSSVREDRRSVFRRLETIALAGQKESCRAMAWMLVTMDHAFQSYTDEAIASMDIRETMPFNGGRYPKHPIFRNSALGSPARLCADEV